MPYLATIETEEARLEGIEESPLIGICFLDVDGRLVQLLDDDPALREALIEYQWERVRQLRLSEPATEPVKTRPTKPQEKSTLSRQKLKFD